MLFPQIAALPIKTITAFNYIIYYTRRIPRAAGISLKTFV
jgi:hypothetical protein